MCLVLVLKNGVSSPRWFSRAEVDDAKIIN